MDNLEPKPAKSRLFYSSPLAPHNKKTPLFRGRGRYVLRSIRLSGSHHHVKIILLWLEDDFDEWTTQPGTLKVESGPSKPVTLQWATYYDAADMAGQSRLYGGIHIAADDFNGRKIGSECGKEAWARAQQLYSGQVQ